MNAQNENSFANRRILVCDDETSVAAATARLLNRALGSECVTVHSADEAIEKLEAETFDALITDMAMPGRPGIELVREVVERWPRMPVMAMTGFANDFPFMDLMKEGAVDFVIKPFHGQELAAKFVRLFREHDAMQALLNDIDRLRQLNVAQALSERKYRSLFQYSMNGLVLVSPDTLDIEEANEAFFELLGKTREGFKLNTLDQILTSNDALRFKAALDHFRKTGHGTLAGFSLQVEEDEPIEVDASLSFVTLESGPMLMLMFKDMTEHRQMQQKLSDLATKDDLTGLYNYRMVFVELEVAIERAKREGQQAAFMFIDLDNFKKCNDTHGHQIGDELLKSVGQIIQNHIRGAADRGFRYGGDEFGVLLNGIGTDIAMKVADRIRAEFEHIEGYGTSMSIGVSPFEEGINGEEWLRRADAALYEAKNAGKNQVHLAIPETDAQKN